MGNPRRLDWNDLLYFLAAARARTLAGAARTLGVKHSTIGRRLTALEGTLGAPLAVRQADGLLLTPLGERVVPIAEEIERSILSVQNLAASGKIRVRLAVPSGFARLLTGYVARFHHEHPGITLELLSGSRPVDLRRSEAEVALRIGPVAGEDLLKRKVGEVGWSLYASEAYLTKRPWANEAHDLSGHDVIGYDTSLADVPAAKWIEEHGQNANTVLRVREMTEMVAAAVAGAGLALLPCFIADAEAALKRLTEEIFARRDISLVYRREARLAEPVQAVINFAAAVMREEADSIKGNSPTRLGLR